LKQAFLIGRPLCLAEYKGDLRPQEFLYHSGRRPKQRRWYAISAQTMVSIGTIDEYMRFENFQWRQWVVPLRLQQIAMRRWMSRSKKEGQFSVLAILKI